MEKLVASFVNHLKSALEISEHTNLNVGSPNIQNVIILGMGGSGIGGSIASQVLANEINVPIISCKDYSIPAFVSEKTLVIASSYSGNTEETLSALNEASKRTSTIVCVCSGGEIQRIAEKNGYGCIVIPGGMPPRAAFGYSFPQLFKIFIDFGLIDWNLKTHFEPAIDLLSQHMDSIKTEAKTIAEKIKNKLPIIYSESGFEGVCVRFRQQINENSKKLCWHHVIPEMNHNELVGWRNDAKNMAVILLRSKDEIRQNKKRIELSKEIFAKYNPEIIEINGRGNSKLEQTLYFVHLCDWISVYIAEINNTDPVEIEVINYFKKELTKD